MVLKILLIRIENGKKSALIVLKYGQQSVDLLSLKYQHDILKSTRKGNTYDWL